MASAVRIAGKIVEHLKGVYRITDYRSRKAVMRPAARIKNRLNIDRDPSGSYTVQ